MLNPDSGGADAPDDPIIYFTLIDFLIQLLFFCVFIFVAISYRAADTKSDLPPWAQKAVYLPLLHGMSPWVDAGKAEELRSLLSNIKDAKTLEELVKFLSGSKDSLAMLNYCSQNPDQCVNLARRCSVSSLACDRIAGVDDADLEKILGALGTPPCEKEAPRALFVISALDGAAGSGGGFQILNISELGLRRLSEAGIILSKGDFINSGDFVAKFERFQPSLLKCSHVVEYHGQSDSLRLNRIVQRVFMTSGM